MQPLTLVLPGEYWDSWVYRGFLYVWDMENSVTIYELDKIVEAISDPDTVFPLTAAFSQGDYLYGYSWELVFSDPEIRSLIETKFSRLAARTIVLDEPRLALGWLDRCNSPFPVLHDDLELYANDAFAVAENGLYSAALRRRGSHSLGVRHKKLWDGPGVSVRANSGTLAIAAGEEGLFEMGVQLRTTRGVVGANAEPKQLASKHTTFANWAFTSVYGSSDLSPGYLVAHDWVSPDSAHPDLRNRLRRLVRTVDQDEIFHSQGLSWARQEKIYLLSGSCLRAVRFTQSFVSDPKKGDPFTELGSLDVPLEWGAPVSAGVAMFGTVIEFERGLLVLRSDGKLFSVPGAPTRWRVFPKSKRYENQLHVISDDALTIYSFNHDYFVSQESKVLGIEWSPERQFQPRVHV